MGTNTRKQQHGIKRNRALTSTQGTTLHQPDLLTGVRQALRQPNPWDLLSIAAVMLDIVDLRTVGGSGAPSLRDVSHLDELVEVFLSSRRLESTAVLTAIAELLGESSLTGRIRAELATRTEELPGWLTRLGPLTIDGVFETTYALGDGNHMLVGAQTAAGHPFTCMVYIDHNFGTATKDGAAIWEPIEAVAAALSTGFADDPDCDIRPLDPATARARITQAIEAGAETIPPFASETWPSARPIAEWVLRFLPEGGVVDVRPKWDEAARQGLAGAFLSSSYAEGLGDDAREALDQLLAFACDFGPGDPLRWSPAAVAVLLTRWLPLRVSPDGASFHLTPDVLRAFVRYSHAERGVRADLTADTLKMVALCESDFRDAVNDVFGDLAGQLAGEA